jgi:hypothetical protein
MCSHDQEKKVATEQDQQQGKLNRLRKLLTRKRGEVLFCAN